jgi:hypothetical protein
VKLGPFSIVGAGVYLKEDLKPGKIMFTGKQSDIVRENMLTLNQEEKQKLAEALKKYKQPK